MRTVALGGKQCWQAWLANKACVQSCTEAARHAGRQAGDAWKQACKIGRPAPPTYPHVQPQRLELLLAVLVRHAAAHAVQRVAQLHAVELARPLGVVFRHLERLRDLRQGGAGG